MGPTSRRVITGRPPTKRPSVAPAPAGGTTNAEEVRSSSPQRQWNRAEPTEETAMMSPSPTAPRHSHSNNRSHSPPRLDAWAAGLASSNRTNTTTTTTSSFPAPPSSSSLARSGTSPTRPNQHHTNRTSLTSSSFSPLNDAIVSELLFALLDRPRQGFIQLYSIREQLERHCIQISPRMQKSFDFPDRAIGPRVFAKFVEQFPTEARTLFQCMRTQSR